MKTFAFTTENDIPMLAVLIKTGDKYGLNDCLTNGDQPLVEFRLERSPGFMISRYYVSTLQMTSTSRGLCLDGGDLTYNVDKDSMNLVRNWMRQVTANEADIIALVGKAQVFQRGNNIYWITAVAPTRFRIENIATQSESHILYEDVDLTLDKFLVLTEISV